MIIYLTQFLDFIVANNHYKVKMAFYKIFTLKFLNLNANSFLLNTKRNTLKIEKKRPDRPIGDFFICFIAKILLLA